jgi:hypothetical protein
VETKPKTDREARRPHVAVSRIVAREELGRGDDAGALAWKSLDVVPFNK